MAARLSSVRGTCTRS